MVAEEYGVGPFGSHVPIRSALWPLHGQLVKHSLEDRQQPLVEWAASDSLPGREPVCALLPHVQEECCVLK